MILYGINNYLKEKDRLRLGTCTLHNRDNTVACGGLEMVGRGSFLVSEPAFGVECKLSERVRRYFPWSRTANTSLHRLGLCADRHRFGYLVTQKGKGRGHRRPGSDP